MAAVAEAPARHDRQSLDGVPVQAAALRRWRLGPVAQREVILALLLTLCYGFFYQVPFWNENSRYDLVLALVDDGATRIDRYHENTGDKSLYVGHYYSDKGPGSSLLGVPVYALMRAMAAQAGSERPDPTTVLHALTFTVSGLTTVLLAVLLLRFLRPHVGERWALTVTVAYALGTIAFPFATMYFGHAASTFFLFAAFYVLSRPCAARSTWSPIWAGFLAGWAVLVEVAAIIGVSVLLLYALSRHRRAPFLMAAGALPPALVLLGYNWVSFGGPFSLSYSNVANSGFAAGMSRGVLGVTEPKLSVLGEILLGPRGLLRLSPWLALAPLGFCAALWRAYSWREVAVCGAIVWAYLLSNAGYYLPLGGVTPGPRFLMPALPFAAVLAGLVPRAARPRSEPLIALSLALVSIATVTMPNATEAVKAPLEDLWLPRFLTGNLAKTTAWVRWGLPGAQPLIVLGLAAAIATGALYATTLRTPLARRLAGVGAGLLAALVLGFGTPLDPSWGVGSSVRADVGRPWIAVAAAGTTLVPGEKGQPKVEAWAHLENFGGEMGQTMVIFSIHDSSGQQVWAAWHGHVRWRPHERKRLGVEWTPPSLAPGEYRLAVRVTAAAPGLHVDEQQVLTRVEDAARLRVRA